MSTLTKILRVAGQLTSLDDDSALYDVIGILGGRYYDLAKVITAADTKRGLIAYLAADAENPALDSLFTALNLTQELAVLRARRNRLLDLLGADANLVSKLLEPVGNSVETGGATSGEIDAWNFGSNDNRIVLPLFEKSVGNGDDSARFGFELGAGAAIEIEYGALWPFNADGVAEPLFRTGVTGTVKAGARAALPLSGAGRFGAGASGEATASLQFFHYQRKPERALGSQLAIAVTSYPDPFDFSSIWNAFARSELGGVILTFKGATTVSVSLALAKSFDLHELVKAEVGIALDVGIEREGDYVLSLRGDTFQDENSRRIRAVLSRADSRTSKLDIGVGLSFDLSAIAQKLHGPLQKALKTWDGALKEFTPFLSPGTYLRAVMKTELQGLAASLLDEGAFRVAIEADIEMALGLKKDDSSAVTAWLAEKLAKATDNAASLVAQGEVAVQGVIDELSAQLPAFARDEMRPLIRGKIKDLADALSAKLTQTVTDVVAAEGASSVNKALKQAGATIDDAVDQADAALAGVRNLLTKYDGLFRQVLAAVQDEARQKMSLRLKWERERVREEEFEIVGTFMDNSAAAAYLYDQLILGRLDAFRALYEQENLAFALDTEGSSLRRFVRGTKGFGYEAVLFGFGTSGKTVSLAEAEFVRLGDGTIRVDTKGSIEREVKGPKEERKLTLLNLHSILYTKAQQDRVEGADLSMRASFGMTHVDDRLHFGELQDFYSNLRALKLIRQGDLDAAIGDFAKMVPDPGSKSKLKGQITVQLALSKKDALQLMRIDTTPSGPLPPDHRLALAQCAVRGLRASGVWSDKEHVDDMAHIRARRPEGIAIDGSDDNLINRLLTVGLNKPKGDIDAKGNGTLDTVLKRAFRFVMYVEQMREIYTAEPGDPKVDPKKWDENRYFKAEEQLAKLGKSWLKTNETILGWFEAEMHPRTSAFMISLLSAASNEGPVQSLSSIKWPDDKVQTTLSGLKQT